MVSVCKGKEVWREGEKEVWSKGVYGGEQRGVWRRGKGCVEEVCGVWRERKGEVPVSRRLGKLELVAIPAKVCD